MTKNGLQSILILVVVAAAHSLSGATPEEVCQSSTPTNCALAVKKALAANPSDPRDILSLAAAWNASYDRRYEELRKAGHLEKSTPDSEKIFAEIKDEIEPVEIAKEKIIDSLAKKYLPRLAAVRELASAPIIKALEAFFDSSEIASDRDELDLMNTDLQRKFADLLSPSFDSDWRQKLLKAATDAGPQLEMP